MNKIKKKNNHDIEKSTLQKCHSELKQIKTYDILYLFFLKLITWQHKRQERMRSDISSPASPNPAWDFLPF